jgi:fucose permease
MKKQIHAILLLVVIYLAFISLGLPDSVLGIAWPSMRIDFSRPLEAAGWLTIIGTACTALSSIMSGHVLARFGTGRVTFVSCLMTAIGLLGYSFAPSFWWLFVFLPFLGFGAGAIDCGLNVYVGANYSSRHMNWLHCCWGIGATLGPMIVTGLLAGGFSWRAGYRTIGCIQLGLAVVLFVSLGLWSVVQRNRVREAERDDGTTNGEKAEHDAGTELADETGSDVSRLRRKAIRLQIAIYALYASCEFLIGLWAYSLLVRERGVDSTSAGLWVSVYYGSLTAARFGTGIIVNRLGNRFMIKAGLVTAFAGVILLAWRFFFPGASDLTALVGLILIGAGFAPVYPCMTHETSRRFRPSTAQKLVGYQTGAASLGGATFPALVGYIGAHTSLEVLPFTEAALIAGTFVLGTMLDRITAKRAL